MNIARLGGLLLVAGIGAADQAAAQMPDPAAAAESREHVASLDWLVGEWEGAGWIMVQGAGRQTFTSSEVVESRLDGRVLLVEGKHRGENGTIVHHALGAITWDAGADRYVFHTWLGTQGGGGAANDLELTESGFRWWPEVAPGGPTVVFDARYENDEWIETGTVTLPDGRSFEFFEMRLRKRS